MKNPITLVIVITILCLAIRLFQLGNLPGILNRDEAALAYNAVLLHETGTDEWQRPWPLALESFGDYKLPGYVMVLVGLFTFLPHEDWVVRLPAAVAGASLVPLSYWLAKNWKYDTKAALTLAALVSLSPVFFFYSRMAFEALLALSLWVFFHALLFKESKSNRQRWVLDASAVVIALVATLTYNTPFLLLPFTVLLVPLVRGVKQWQSWLGTVIGLVVVFMVVGLVLLPLTGQKKGITLFSDETTLTNSIEYRQSLPAALQPILGNKYLYLAGIMAKNTLASFSPAFLVTKGGTHPWHTQPGFSHFGWTIFALGIVGFVSLVIQLGQKVSTRKPLQPVQVRHLVLLLLLITSLAPSVITVDAPHTTRSLPFLFWWLVVAVEGLVTLSSWLKPKLKKGIPQLAPAVIGIAVILAAAEFGWYSFNYFTQFPNHQPDALKVGFDQAIRQAEEKHPNTPIAVVDGDGFHYILTAWYLHLSPEDYFSSVVRQQPNSIGFRYGEKVSHYHFIAHSTDRPKTNETVMLNWIDNQWQLQTF